MELVSGYLNVPPRLTLNTRIYIFVAQIVYAFSMILATNSHNFPEQHSLIGPTKKNTHFVLKKEWFLCLTEGLRSTINTLTM
jgi:hypothetical protein